MFSLFQIFRQDLRDLRWFIALWCSALIALAWASQPGATSTELPNTTLLVVVSLVLWFILFGRIVFNHPPNDDRADWRNRPIDGAIMGTEKLLLAGVLLIGLPHLATAWGSFGPEPGGVVAQSLGVLGLLVLASFCRTSGRFLLVLGLLLVLLMVASSASVHFVARGVPEWRLRPGAGWILMGLAGLSLLVILLRQYRRPQNLLHGLALGGVGVVLALVAVGLAQLRPGVAGDPLPPGVQLRIAKGQLHAVGDGVTAATLRGDVVSGPLPAASFWTFDVRVTTAPPGIIAPRRPISIGGGSPTLYLGQGLAERLGVPRLHDVRLRGANDQAFSLPLTQGPGSRAFLDVGPETSLDIELSWTQLRLERLGSIPFEQGAGYQGNNVYYRILEIPQDRSHETTTHQIVRSQHREVMPLFILASGEGVWLGVDRTEFVDLNGRRTVVTHHQAYADVPAEPIVRVDLYRFVRVAKGREQLPMTATVTVRR